MRREMTAPSIEQASVVALAAANRAPWHEIAALVCETRSALRVLDGEATALDAADRELWTALRTSVSHADVHRWWGELRELCSAHPDLALVTVLDDGYPANLREVYNRPPFIFV